jgi:hypothetical protein
MKTVKIGENAGKIWNTLNKSGEMTIAQVKKKATLNDVEANMALGWLAREDKIAISKRGNSTKISLI